MSEKNEYMTVKEFAEAVGITEQAVYKQLNNRLSTFSTKLNGRKVLKIQALQEYGLNKIQPNIQPVEQPVVQLFQPEFNPKLAEKEAEICHLQEQIQQQKIEELSRHIEALKEQLRVKDEQIRAKDQQIESLHEILSRQQQLAAIQEQRIIQLTASEPETATTVEHEGSKEDPAAGLQKKGLFRRIWEALTED